MTMKKQERQAYLIGVDLPQQAPRVYAVVAETAQEALTRVEVLAEEGASVALAGGMAADMVRHLRLKPGEPRLV
ncbi:MAG: hypothetical protein MIN69_13755 [Methylorubrum extorquens]|jgi:hypothetical protein|uniref:hypothetical protein n=1 Tax=Methylorubrum extorquens TaxID=408 RepID=UPI002FEDF904